MLSLESSGQYAAGAPQLIRQNMLLRLIYKKNNLFYVHLG